MDNLMWSMYKEFCKQKRLKECFATSLVAFKEYMKAYLNLK